MGEKCAKMDGFEIFGKKNKEGESGEENKNNQENDKESTKNEFQSFNMKRENLLKKSVQSNKKSITNYMKSKEDKPSVSLSNPTEKRTITMTESNSESFSSFKNSLIDVAHSDEQLATRFKTKVLRGEE